MGLYRTVHDPMAIGDLMGYRTYPMAIGECIGDRMAIGEHIGDHTRS